MKKIFLAAIAALASAASSPADAALRVWPQESPFVLPVIVERASGSYDRVFKGEAELVFFDSDIEAMAAMASGDVEIAMAVDAESFIAAAAAGLDAKILTVAARQRGENAMQLTVAASRAIAERPELIEKIITMREGSTSYIKEHAAEAAMTAAMRTGSSEEDVFAKIDASDFSPQVTDADRAALASLAAPLGDAAPDISSLIYKK